MKIWKRSSKNGEKILVEGIFSMDLSNNGKVHKYASTG